jgi:hypothetical protein
VRGESTRRRVARILVVVPARNEELLLPSCLAALDRAIARAAVPVHVEVVLDGCTDGTPGIAAGWPGVHVLRVRHRCVGRVRDDGVRSALARFADEDPSSLWLAHTDADSTVPGHWLGHQLELADDGADLVLGTVEPRGGSATPATLSAWHAAYAGAPPGDRGHQHVHGANLGVRASTYLAAGGFPPEPAHEDRLLVDRVNALPDVVAIATIGAPVRTSDRLDGRVRRGVSSDLRQLQQPGAARRPVPPGQQPPPQLEVQGE